MTPRHRGLRGLSVVPHVHTPINHPHTMTHSGVAYVLHEAWPKQEKPPTEFVFSIYGQVRDRT